MMVFFAKLGFSHPLHAGNKSFHTQFTSLWVVAFDLCPDVFQGEFEGA